LLGFGLAQLHQELDVHRNLAARVDRWTPVVVKIERRPDEDVVFSVPNCQPEGFARDSHQSLAELAGYEAPFSTLRPVVDPCLHVPCLEAEVAQAPDVPLRHGLVD
jgi:hypothetical protein